MSESENRNGHALQKALIYVRHLTTLLIVTFVFGGWIMHQQTEIAILKEENERQKMELKEWWEWRNGTTTRPGEGITTKVSVVEGKISHIYERLGTIYPRLDKLEHKP